MRNRPLVQLAATAVGATFLLVVYLVLTVYGSVVDLDSDVNVVPVNVADNVLHLVLGVAMIGLGVVPGKRAAHTATTSTSAR